MDRMNRRPATPGRWRRAASAARTSPWLLSCWRWWRCSTCITIVRMGRQHERDRAGEHAPPQLTVLAGLVGRGRRHGRARPSPSVPLYSLFCQATGFGGTTQVARKAGRPEPSTARSRCASTPTSTPPAVGLPAGTARDRGAARRGAHGHLPRDQPLATGRSSAPRPTTSRPTRPGSISTSSSASASTSRRWSRGRRSTCRSIFFVDPAMAEDPDARRRPHHHAVLHLLPGA